MFGHIDDAATALANLLEQFVAADGIAGFLDHDAACPCAARGRIIKVIAGVAGGSQQLQDALPQFRIGTARGLQVGRPLLRRQFESGLKNGLLVLVRRVH
ncbi:MAG TPA: hypothetical protein VMS21_14570 [Methylomirabilota bacterium]|nr:hypothetical protein [Methylomirabilota bacterium]